METETHKPTVAALLGFAILSLVLTLPLALHLGDAVEDRQDALLNVWITAWDGHQLVSDPLHLFDANIFWPYSQTLAYSELLLGNGLLALPIIAASGNPVLGYNVAVLLSFVLTGLGTYLLVFQLTRSRGAGWVAGAVFAFCSYRMSNLAQAQLLTTQWMPLTFLALYHLIHRPRLRHVLTFVCFFTLQTLSSFYYGMILGLAVAVVCLLEGGFWAIGRIRSLVSAVRRPPSVGGRTLHMAGWRPVAYLLFAVCLALLLILPFALPYLQVQREMGFERSLAESEPFSATLRQFVSVPPGSTIVGQWLPSDEALQAGGYPVDALFPGFVAVMLGLFGLFSAKGRIRWYAFLLLVGSCSLSLGPRLYLAPGRPSSLAASLPYAWLYAALPGFSALRAPVRFDALAMLALAVLAGYGVAGLERLWAARRPGFRGRWATWLSAVLAALVVLESAVWPAAHAEHVPVGEAVPPVYRWLAGQPRGPTLELPMAFTPGGPQLDYQYLSTYHWQATPDGYSGFIPPKHGQLVYEMARFPSERSVRLLQALGVQYVLIHTGSYPANHWQQMEGLLAQAPDLAPVGAFGPDQVYRVRERGSEPEDLAISGYLPPQAEAGQPYVAYVVVVNRGPRSYATQPTARLCSDAVWEAAGQSYAETVCSDVPLVTSPNGGAAVIPVTLEAPSQPSTYDLTLSRQGNVLQDWKLEGEVAVGGSGKVDEAQIPVPARLVAGSVPPAARPGQALPVRMTWRALGKIDAYYSVYVKLLDRAGNAVAGWDGQPQDGRAPTLHWVPGETIEDVVTLELPAGTPAGTYAVEVGMYRASDLAGVLTLDAGGELIGPVVLGTVRVGP